MNAKKFGHSADNGNAKMSLIGENCRLNGHMETPSTLILCGDFEGTITCKSLETAVGSRVSAKVNAGDAIISGFFEGEIVCHNVLTVAKTGKVTGKISYGTLTVEPGGVIEGNTSRLESREAKVLSIPEAISSSSTSA
jgi:cytoskeletal protein CcmA (bactofilin family)